MHRTLRSYLPLGIALLLGPTLQAQWELVGPQQFSNGWARHTNIAFAPDNTPYVAYTDMSLLEKVVVKRYIGDVWETVGTAGFSAGSALDLSLAFSPEGTPYVAYRDMTQSQKATVMSFQGGNWQVVGQAGLSEGQAMLTCVAIAPNGTPYLSYRDAAHEYKVTTQKFENGAWSLVGGAGHTPYYASSLSMAFDHDGVVHVALAGTGGSRVERFVNGAWQLLGEESSFYNASTASLAIASDNTVYMAYLDGSNDFGGSMKRYVNGAWEQVGPVAFTNEDASMDYYTMALDGNDVPYVAYKDSHAEQKATVQRFVNGAWENVGPISFTPSAADFVSLAIDQGNVPYVVFSDATGFTFKSTVMRYANGPSSVTERDTDGLALWPSPAQDMVHVNDVAQGAWVMVLDLAGQEVSRHRASGGLITLDTTGLPNGVYLVRTQQQGTSRTARLVVAH